MATATAPQQPPAATAAVKLPIIDTDVHPATMLTDPTLRQFVPQKWIDYHELIGLRPSSSLFTTPPHRPNVQRLDSDPPEGGIPGSSPSFAARQLLDEYDMSAGILSNTRATFYQGNGYMPTEMAVDMCRAHNDWHRERWIEDDPRWYASINVPHEMPELAAAEIHRCMGLSDRYVQVQIERRQDYPSGHPRYWPIYAACAEYDIPVAFHTGGNRRTTACGQPSTYFEEHCDYALSNGPSAASFIFEGVFEQFPTLQVVYIEQTWAWAVPFSWRLDASYRKLRDEVGHLKRWPSEYLRDHFYFTSQPMEEPEALEETVALFEQMVDAGLEDRLMFSSDYPHWDFDAPADAVPAIFPLKWRQKILGESASKLYKIALLPDSGIEVPV